MKQAALLALLILGVLTVGSYVRRDIIRLDGMRGEIFHLIIGEDTQYATGYSHVNFAKIQVGMSQDQVEDIIGKPLGIWKPYNRNYFYINKRHFVGYEYSRGLGDGNYRIRQVNFDKGKVAEIIHYFYVD